VCWSASIDAGSTFPIFSTASARPGAAGWLEKDDVLNTRPLAALRRLLKRTM